MRILSCCLFLFVLSHVTFAQLSEGDTSTILDNFIMMLDESNTYEKYKIIRIESLDNFKHRLSREIKDKEYELIELKNIINSQEEDFTKLTSSLAEAQASLEQIEINKDNMFLFGFLISKLTYQIISLLVFSILVSCLVIVLVKFKENTHTAKTATDSLREVESILEEHKKRALEIQQKLGRELQDYKNKLAQLKNS